MEIIFHEQTGEFHISNGMVSYIIQILENGQLGNLYYGPQIHDREDFSYLLEGGRRSLAVYQKEQEYFLSQQYTRMEYPSFGTGDFRYPAVSLKQEDGSRITCFQYRKHCITEGKQGLAGLPATYVEEEEEAKTLEITMTDALLQVDMILSYTIFRDFPAIARSVRYQNRGESTVTLERAMSLSVDLPDADYEMITLSGSWARERHVKSRRLQQGIQGVYSMCGISSAEHNPFIALKRPETTEAQGEAYGFSLIYSGNHLEQVEVDTHHVTRVMLGIHPDTFAWSLGPGQEFQTPEAVMVYAWEGLNQMSQAFHRLYRTRLARGRWRDRERPILINNWEATGMNFTQEKILDIARKGKSLGMELFVLDDGWFGGRDDDTKGLGDWYVTDSGKLPEGVGGLARKIEDLGMKFGLWFEPEMVNRETNLYSSHPDWLLCAPGRAPSPSRNQYVLDFTRQEVVDYIHDQMYRVLSENPISYVKWDMNRYITECYSIGQGEKEQGEVYHRYILGVYSLYERLTGEFPEILFESCSSGGARFDPGMLYYAPQAWTSDDTDAIERVKIQYGTSYVYPVSSMGAHVSAVPNQQVDRCTPLETRGNVAMFGAFGYELDLAALSREEEEVIRRQIAFVKEHRKLIQRGTFYRLMNPFAEQAAAWMVVSADRGEALAGYYQLEGYPNAPWERLYFQGLDPDKKYCVNDREDKEYYGDELMHAGLPITHSGSCLGRKEYASTLYYLREKKTESNAFDPSAVKQELLGNTGSDDSAEDRMMSIERGGTG